MKTIGKYSRINAAGALLLATLSSYSIAEVVSIDITAVVAHVDDYGNYLGGKIKPGDEITGTYIYDTAIPDTNPLANVGDYEHTTPGFGVCLDAAGIKFRSHPTMPQFLLELVNNHYNNDAYLFHSYNNAFDIAVPLNSPYEQPDNIISWQLDDDTQQALSHLSLTNQAPDLNAWQSWFGLNIHSRSMQGEFMIRAHVTSAVRSSSTCETKSAPASAKYIAHTLLHRSTNINDKTEAVLYNNNGTYTIATRHLVSGTPGTVISLQNIINAKPIGMIGIKDTNSNSYPDIALLYTDGEGKSAHIRIIDSYTQSTLRVIYSTEPQSIARTLELIPDLNRNGFEEMAVLHEATINTGVVEAIDSKTGATIYKRQY